MMNRICFFLLSNLVLTGVAFSQQVEFSANDWQKPAIFEKGQNAPHAAHVSYSSKEAALSNRKNRCENFQSLNGTWQFKWVETTEQVPEGFWEPDFDVSEWDRIQVPSNWQMEGYGHPKFRNIALSFESNPPYIPAYYNPTGCYKRKINIPKDWENKAVMLRFEGVKSASYVWVNGRRVGYNQGGFEPAEYNISPFLEPGENDLAVQVLRFSDGSYLENQDMWRLSGIFRDVELHARPKTFIHDYYMVTDLDREYKNATLTVEADIQNLLADTAVCAIEIDVLDATERSVLPEDIQAVNFTVMSESIRKITIATELINPPKWSAEHPNLFTVLFHLKDAQGNTLEAFSKKTGFRKIEYKNQVFTVNGVAVKLNGVNSHMHHPKHGQAVPTETLKKDLILMKQFNINCVRTSHYPPSPEYLEMADELGMYIIDEVGDEAHSNLQLSAHADWTEMFRDRSRKLVYRDRSHPSVIMWSAGNEAGSGNNIHEVIRTGKAIDPNRPAWMYGGNTFYIPFEDIVGPRYWAPLDYKNLADGKVLPANDRRASFMDEYLAATGNGLGGLDEYWELIWKNPRLIGGAIWDWVSPAIETPRWILPDLSPHKNDGQIMGRPVFRQGKYGWGLEFSGHDDWVEFYRDPVLDINGNQLSIGFWVKPFKIAQANSFVTKGKHQYGIRMENPETLEFYIHSDKRVSAKVKVPDDFYDNWHHIAGIYDGRTLQLFIDENRVAQTPFNGNIANTPFPLCIGREAETHDQGEFSGRLSKMIIDELRIFDKAVSLNDLKNNTDAAVLALDFEEDQKQGHFYAVGLGGRTYGMVWPDRKVQPEIYQVKKAGQPVKTEAVDMASGIVKITNRHHFTNLNELLGLWQLTVNGDTIQRGFFEINLPPGQSVIDTLEFRMPQINQHSECLMTVSFLVKEDTPWAKAGHEVAWDEMTVPAVVVPENKNKVRGNVAVSEQQNTLIISGEKFSYTIDKAEGRILSLLYDGQEYLTSGPVFNVWRAPLANDVDPWGSYEYTAEKMTPGFGRSIDNQLRSLGLHCLHSEVDEIDVTTGPDGTAIVRIKAFSHASRQPELKMTQGKSASAFERNEVWTFFADGTLELEQQIIPHGPMPDMLPKIGLQFQLPKKLNRVEYFGRGPHENYPDRKTGAKTGKYKTNVAAMYEPYIMPQDYGNRCDVRWLKVHNNQDRGIMMEAHDCLNFSFHGYSTDNLERAAYAWQLRDADSNTLNIDYEVSGVGGTAIRQLQRYRVMPHDQSYKLTLRPF